MALNRLLQPYFTHFLTSSTLRNIRRGWFEIERRVIPSQDVITFYHQVNDPYSFLLLQAIPRFLEDFKATLQIRLVLNLPEEIEQPHRTQQEAYALIDAKRLAILHNLVLPAHIKQPSDEDAFNATSLLLKHQTRPKLLHLVTEVTSALWGCSTTTFLSAMKRYGTLKKTEAKSIIQHNMVELQTQGHYQPAMLYYGYEWYWGLDRLAHLADRLDKPGIRRNTGDIADYQRQYRHVLQGYNTLRPRPKQVKPLDFYISFRSPYSYLAADRLFRLVDLYKVPIIIKPVLPMVSRGIPLTKSKQRYILFDGKREAEKHNIPFGKICDPLGTGINNAMSLFLFAQRKGKDREFVVSILSGIWAEGLDITHLPYLKRIINRADLDWNEAKDVLDNNEWETSVNRHHAELDKMGIRGVPTLKYGDLILWGQDRLWVLEESILMSTKNSEKAS